MLFGSLYPCSGPALKAPMQQRMHYNWASLSAASFEVLLVPPQEALVSPNMTIFMAPLFCILLPSGLHGMSMSIIGIMMLLLLLLSRKPL